MIVPVEKRCWTKVGLIGKNKALINASAGNVRLTLGSRQPIIAVLIPVTTTVALVT